MTAALVAAALFGQAGTAQALGPAGTTPTGVGAVRLLLGGLVLAALVQASGGWSGIGLRAWRRPVVLAAAACVALYQVAFFAGVDRAGVAVGTLVAVGSAPVGAGNGRASGVLLALVAGAAIAGFSVLASRAMGAGIAGLPFLAVSFIAAAAALLPLAVTQPLRWLLEPPGVLLALHLGVVTMAVANVAYARGLAALGPGPTSTLLLAEPAVALALAIVVLREPLGVAAVAGSVLVGAALGLQVLGGSARGRRVDGARGWAGGRRRLRAPAPARPP